MASQRGLGAQERSRCKVACCCTLGMNAQASSAAQNVDIFRVRFTPLCCLSIERFLAHAYDPFDTGALARRPHGATKRGRKIVRPHSAHLPQKSPRAVVRPPHRAPPAETRVTSDGPL